MRIPQALMLFVCLFVCLFLAQCEVQDHSIKVFDQLRYQHNIKGGCPYVLVQEHRQGKQQSRIQVGCLSERQKREFIPHYSAVATEHCN